MLMSNLFEATPDPPEVDRNSLNLGRQGRTNRGCQAVRTNSLPGIRRAGELDEHLRVLRNQFSRITFNGAGGDRLHHSHVDTLILKKANQAGSQSGLANACIRR